jgi:hypothetical protein
MKAISSPFFAVLVPGVRRDIQDVGGEYRSVPGRSWDNRYLMVGDTYIYMGTG